MSLGKLLLVDLNDNINRNCLRLIQYSVSNTFNLKFVHNDNALEYYRKISKVYGSDDFLVITYSPFKDLMSDEVLADIKALSSAL